MRPVIISVGRLKSGPERDLVDRYATRFGDMARKLGFKDLELRELPESRARDAATRMAEEAQSIFALIPERSVVIAMDERGRNLASPDFARQFGQWRDQSIDACIFIIGGADGLSPELRRKSDLTLAYGAATWPHQMVRILLLEQIYRAATILAGHPYHRA